MSGSLPLSMAASGPVATSATLLQSTLITAVAAQVPGYTASLPASLIEDVSSTEVGGLSIIDQARVDAVNSVTPYGANAFVLAQQGQQFGIPQGLSVNASVYLVFYCTSSGSPQAGYVIPAGFTISDGTYQYTVQDGGVTLTGGYTAQLFAIAVLSGTWAIGANTVTSIVTSVPSPYVITVTNPNAGTPGTGAQSVDAYRAQILQSYSAPCTGVPATLRTLLEQITGVQPQLVSINSVSGGWQIICGGGDAYAVGAAILAGVGDISRLQGTALAITGITAAANAVITTNLNHNFTTGVITITGATPSAYNTTYTITSVTATTITTSRNSSAFGAYVSGATFLPNPRNVTASIFQNPNTYNLLFINPPQQVVTVAVTWNTTLTGFTATSSVAQLGAPAIQAYINGIYVGQPINALEMVSVFQTAIASVLATVNLTTLTFAVTINGVTVSPSAGTSLYLGDPESYFYCSPTGVTVIYA